MAAIPTETVYGLAALATKADACAAIFRLKGRPLIDPLIVHIGASTELSEVAEGNPAADRLIEAFWPGPLTLVLPKTTLIPSIVTAGRGTVAVRCPAHPVFRELYDRVRSPLAAPSANPFGYISPTRAIHVLESFPDAGLPVLDGGPCAIGIESTIVDLTVESAPRLLRAGLIPPDEIGRVLGQSVLLHREAEAGRHPSAALPAPGMMAKHYSPRTPSTLIPHRKLLPEDTLASDCARVFFQRPGRNIREDGDFWLSEKGGAAEAARSLYHLLRVLDNDETWSRILLEAPPERPDTMALSDRLFRATQP